jgi:hypothetical protein
MNNRKPTLLFHYCNLDTFISMIKNRSVWLTDVSMSNDSQELRWFKNEFYTYIAYKIQNNPDPITYKICETIISLAIFNGYDVPYEGLVPHTKQIQKVNSFFDFSRCYAFCLSELGDSLGQWRGYACDGMGVSIGFKRKYFDILHDACICSYNRFMFSKVNYGNKKINELFDEIWTINQNDPSASNRDRSLYIAQLLFNVSFVAPLFKNPSFQEEKEWRVEYSINDYDYNHKITELLNNDAMYSEVYKKKFEFPVIDFRAKENKIVPHMELTFKNMAQVIDCIIIGPKSSVTENDMKLFLVSQGFLSKYDDTSIKIIKSKSSYQ